MAINDYVSLDKLGALFSMYRNSTKLIHFNAQSARNKEDQISALFTTLASDPEYLMITETWYRNETEVLKIPGYATYFLNRSTKTGGGVLLMTRNSLKCSLILEFSRITDDYEVLTVRSDRYVIGVLYRPPSGNKSNFLEFLDSYLCWAGDTGCKLVLAGDLNIDLARSSQAQLELCHIIESNGFANVITTPTSIEKNNATLLDVFITNIEAKNSLSGVLSVPISDHLPIFMMINETVSSTVATKTSSGYSTH